MNQVLRNDGVAPLWARLVATFFGIGWLKPGPGTWGLAGGSASVVGGEPFY